MPRKKIPQEEIDASLAALAFKPTTPVPSERLKGTKGESRIMYIERKAGRLIGEAVIGRVTFSKSRKSLYYKGRHFKSHITKGFKSNYYESETGEAYWISGPKKNGEDRLYGERLPIDIDEDVRSEYWTDIRGEPERAGEPRA